MLSQRGHWEVRVLFKSCLRFPQCPSVSNLALKQFLLFHLCKDVLNYTSVYYNDDKSGVSAVRDYIEQKVKTKGCKRIVPNGV